MEDCRNCKQYEICPCGKRGHENGSSIGYSIGECKNYEPKYTSTRKIASMRLIDANKLKKEAETCIETTDAFIELIDEQPTVSKKNLLDMPLDKPVFTAEG